MALDLGTLVGYLELDTKKWEGPLAGVGQKMPGWMATAGATAAVALAAAFSAAFVNAATIDAGNDKIAAQLGLTEAEAERAGAAAAGAYGNAFGENMAAVQGATAGVISSIGGMRDANVEDLQDITEKVLTLSDGFELEADRISQVVGQMLSTGLVSSAEEGLDLLTVALQKVPAAVREDILDATDEYGPFFAAVGMSGEEAMGALVAASEKGMYGIDKTGDAVKEFGIRATDMSAASVAAYEAAGLNAEEMSAKILAGGDTAGEGFQQIIDGLLGIEDPVARSNAAIGLFGTPLEDLGVNEIPTFLAGLKDVEGGLGDVAGAAAEMGDTAGSNVATSWTAIQRSFEGVMTTVASGLLPILQPLMAWIAENPAIIQILVAALAVLTIGFIALTVATWAMNTALLSNPITWIVLGIMALIAALVLLVMNWDTVVAWISEVWAGFIGWITGVIDGFIGWWNGVWAGFASWIGEVWSGFVGFISDVWSGFMGWLQGVIDGFFGWWNGIWSAVGSFFESVWNNLVTWAVGLIAGWIGGWMSLFSGLSSFFSGLWSGITDTIRNTWNGVTDFLSGIPDKIMSFFGGIGTWLLGAGEDLIQGFIDGIGNMIGGVGDAIGGVMDFVGGFFPHSPAKWGPFSGSGWTDLLDSGGALMAQFTDGMLGADPFSDARIQAALSGGWADDPEAPREASGDTFIYHAAEGQSLSSEEALFAALGSPRTPFGGNA